MRDLLKDLKSFLEKYYEKHTPILLGFSGGVDSRALFELLMKCREEFSINLHLAHIDHGQRSSSTIEAKELQKEMRKRNVPFHLYKIEVTTKGNLEDFFRNERFSFFKTLFEKFNFSFLLLAHQKDDVIETVLKRVLEGANVAFLGGINFSSKMHQLQVYRPLIHVFKKDIAAWLDENKINYIDDITNKDPIFLRARMREQILPHLNKTFHKGFKDNLYQLSLYSFEIKGYLDRKIDQLYKSLKRGPFGSLIDLNDVSEPVEIRHFIKKIAKIEHLDLSRAVIDQLILWILSKRANLQFNINNLLIIADRGYLFFVKEKLPQINPILIKEGVYNIGNCRIKIEKGKFDSIKNSSWKELFLGKAQIYIPDTNDFESYKVDSKIKKILSKNKVPSFMWGSFFTIVNNKNVFEFFTGKNKHKIKQNKHFLKISLEILK